MITFEKEHSPVDKKAPRRWNIRAEAKNSIMTLCETKTGLLFGKSRGFDKLLDQMNFPYASVNHRLRIPFVSRTQVEMMRSVLDHHCNHRGRNILRKKIQNFFSKFKIFFQNSKLIFKSFVKIPVSNQILGPRDHKWQRWQVIRWSILEMMDSSTKLHSKSHSSVVDMPINFFSNFFSDFFLIFSDFFPNFFPNFFLIFFWSFFLIFFLIFSDFFLIFF